MSADEQDIREIARHYGIDNQLIQAMEEASELITAISHYRRRRDGSRRELLEEMADMEIMIRQLQILTGTDAGEMEALTRGKLRRQIGRIRKERK
jgi:NTP pyrophosphatase (non-canonical NTP hydrolase)